MSSETISKIQGHDTAKRPLKRFLVFSGLQYYPAGGWGDFLASFDTLEEAKAAEKERERCCEWAQIVDSEIGEEVY